MPRRIALPVAGDPPEARRKVMRLAAADRGRLHEYRGKAHEAAHAFFASQPQ